MTPPWFGTRRGHWLVLDAGPRFGSMDAGKWVVLSFLLTRGAREIDVFALSHPDLDHVGGAVALLDRFRVRRLLGVGMPVPSKHYRAVRKAGLIDVLGAIGEENVHGERVQKLDEYANEVIFNALDNRGHLCLMASEESAEPIPIPEQFPKGDYVFLYDPLDGSSNIAANVSIGTIFSIQRRREGATGDGALADLLQVRGSRSRVSRELTRLSAAAARGVGLAT